ncbi:hypothetical protein RB195_015665 [Necator americanus]|uniref:Uncharacterized protein n=1 Tax=Necator americanus TaxID=51031 RepID=A0ABR1E5S2_NECAM
MLELRKKRYDEHSLKCIQKAVKGMPPMLKAMKKSAHSISTKRNAPERSCVDNCKKGNVMKLGVCCYVGCMLKSNDSYKSDVLPGLAGLRSAFSSLTVFRGRVK